MIRSVFRGRTLWLWPVIPELNRLKHNDQNFKAILDNIVVPCLKHSTPSKDKAWCIVLLNECVVLCIFFIRFQLFDSNCTLSILSKEINLSKQGGRNQSSCQWWMAPAVDLYPCSQLPQSSHTGFKLHQFSFLWIIWYKPAVCFWNGFQSPSWWLLVVDSDQMLLWELGKPQACRQRQCARMQVLGTQAILRISIWDHSVSVLAWIANAKSFRVGSQKLRRKTSNTKPLQVLGFVLLGSFHN